MIGRPTKITKEVLEKLEHAFLQGLSDEEACLLVEIDPKTLYNYCDKHPNFSSKKEHLKQRPKMLAKMNIYKKLESGDVDISKWYLERKAKDEFSIKQEISTPDQFEAEKLRQSAEFTASLRAIAESCSSPARPAS